MKAGRPVKILYPERIAGSLVLPPAEYLRIRES
jgi:hypothetical protein